MCYVELVLVDVGSPLLKSFLALRTVSDGENGKCIYSRDFSNGGLSNGVFSTIRFFKSQVAGILCYNLDTAGLLSTPLEILCLLEDTRRTFVDDVILSKPFLKLSLLQVPPSLACSAIALRLRCVVDSLHSCSFCRFFRSLF